LFFGLPKLFKKKSLPSIKRFILKYNPKCHVYLHSYNITTLEANKRNKEPSITSFNIKDVFLLTKNVVLHTNDEFLEQRNLSYYRQFFPKKKKSWIYPQSLDNMMKQWHSIESVWKLMDRSNFKYDRVGLFRSDLFYMNPINITSLKYGNAVVPDFGLVNQSTELNDRLFYGNYDIAKIWASQRFQNVERYMQSAIGRENGLHSETFLFSLLKQFQVTRAPICAQRVRLTGKVEHDCWCNAATPRLKICPWWKEYIITNGVDIRKWRFSF